MRSTSTWLPERRQAQAGKTESFVAAGGAIVRYIEMGAEHPGPPLVMLHGFRAGADYWFPHPLPALAAQYHVIAPDLPGFGSSGPLAHYGLDAYAGTVLAFMDALGLQRANLLGHSMGGQVAMATAAKQPGRIERLVLVDSAGLRRMEPHWQMPLRMLTDASLRHVRLYPMIMRLGAMATAGREGMEMLQREHVSNILKSLTMPVLVVWGSRDRVVPLEHGALLSRYIPNARLAVIRGAGHMPFYQKPEEFNRIVLAFLRSQPLPHGGRAGQGNLEYSR